MIVLLCVYMTLIMQYFFQLLGLAGLFWGKLQVIVLTMILLMRMHIMRALDL